MSENKSLFTYIQSLFAAGESKEEKTLPAGSTGLELKSTESELKSTESESKLTGAESKLTGAESKLKLTGLESKSEVKDKISQYLAALEIKGRFAYNFCIEKIDRHSSRRWNLEFWFTRKEEDKFEVRLNGCFDNYHRGNSFGQWDELETYLENEEKDEENNDEKEKIYTYPNTDRGHFTTMFVSGSLKRLSAILGSILLMDLDLIARVIVNFDPWVNKEWQARSVAMTGNTIKLLAEIFGEEKIWISFMSRCGNNDNFVSDENMPKIVDELFNGIDISNNGGVNISSNGGAKFTPKYVTYSRYPPKHS